MTKQEMLLKLQQYVKTHNGDWIGVHDTHKKGISEKIENLGLCVSHNPYGNKVRRFMNESGKIDLSKDFMATMNHLSNENDIQLFTTPVEPLIVNIPKQILEMFNKNELDEDSYKIMCMYAFQEPSTKTTDENGNFVETRGDIYPQDEPEGANIRLLPACFIAGHFDMESGEFIDNPKHFSKLPPERQQKAIDFFTKLSKERLTSVDEKI